MKRFTSLILSSLLTLTMLTLASCNISKEQKIVIITTNDIHSSIDRIPNLATLVDSIRANNEDVLLIDMGDTRTGNPFVDLAEHSGRPIIELMNALGYNFATIGNHEFDEGTDTLSARMNDAKFKYLVANMHSNGSLPQPAPYAIVKVGDIKVGLVGLIHTSINGHPEGKDERFGNAKFDDPIETAKEYKYLTDSCDVLVAMTHMGYKSDSLLATKVPEYDLILGGHSHTKLTDGGKWIDGTLITQTGKSLEYAGITTITLKNGKITDISNQLVKLADIAPCPKFTEMVNSYKNNPELAQIVGQASVDMKKPALTNLMADAIRMGTGADIALVNHGGMRIDELPAGNITLKDIYSMEPFGNTPYIVPMTLDDMKFMLLTRYNSDTKDSHMIDLYVSGINYQIITDKDDNCIDVIFSNIAAVKKGIYNVAMSDYVYGVYTYNNKGQGTPTGKLITKLVIDYISKKSPVGPNDEVRASIKK